MVRNILPKNIQCIFVRQPEQLGLGHAVLCAERAVGKEPFAGLLADDFITDCKKSVTASLVEAFSKSGKSQLSIMKVDGPEISKYGVIIKSETEGNISGIIEKPAYWDAPSNLASIGRYVLTPDIFDILGKLTKSVGNKIQLVDAINFLAKRDAVDTVVLEGTRFDCGSIDGFISAINHEYEKKGNK